MKILTPLAVPWMVAPSHAGVTVLTEDDEYGTHQVRFAAQFGLEAAAVARPGIAGGLQGTPVVDPQERCARHQLVCLTFSSYGWMRRTPRVSDTEVILRADYDWSRVAGAPLAGESVAVLNARVQRIWRETGLCPDPKVYTVENSDWDVGHDNTRLALHHFLIVGEASCVEILPGRCEWESEGNLSR